LPRFRLAPLTVPPCFCLYFLQFSRFQTFLSGLARGWQFWTARDISIATSMKDCQNRRCAGIVLAGTHTWNRSRFEQLVPRILVPVVQRPLLSYAVNWLFEGGVANVTVCTNRQSRSVRSALEQSRSILAPVSFVEDSTPRGAGGSVRDAAAVTDADTFIVVDGASIPTLDLTRLIQSHWRSGAVATVVADVDESDAAGSSVPTGVYLFERDVLACVPARGFYDIKENMLPALYRAGARVSLYTSAEACPRVLGPASYLAANQWMVERTCAAEPPQEFTRLDGAFIHDDAEVASDAILVGPVVVGAGAQVKSGAVVVGPSSLGRDVIIEERAMVSRSAVWRRSVVAQGASVDGCILLDDVVTQVDEYAAREILSARRAARRLVPQVAVTRPDDQPYFDLARRIGRLVVGTQWSRSPAAQ